ncbi:telomere-protecting terminal protein Tpg [Streptomyces rochei]|uniref:telomere-protecting terminal protein Tpg n=1 Tax=Streptomyces rochei TaxID=1928 RepID=UPI003680BAD6
MTHAPCPCCKSHSSVKCAAPAPDCWFSQAARSPIEMGGIVIDTRARMGYTAPIGSTDQDRIRHLTVALPPVYAARLFDAQEQGATDQQLQEIAAEALKEVYFQDGGRRAGSLEEVRFTDIEHLEFDL